MQDRVRKILMAVLIAIALCAAGYLIWYYMIADQTEDSYDKARDEAEKVWETEKPDETQKKTLEIPIDFAALQAVNPDVYAWIRIDGTTVDYPIVQRRDDENYYLDHTWEGNVSPEGAIFTQACNAIDFTDFNTAIYGHQMGEGVDTMFHTLNRYLEEGFMEQYPEVVIYTPDHIMTYRVFAAVVYDDRHLIQYFNYVMNSQRQAFLDSILNSRDMRNKYSDAESVGITDRIVSLSTCISGEPGHRLLIEAVLVNEE